MRPVLLLLPLLLLPLLLLGACRSPEELVAEVNAIVIVIGLEEKEGEFVVIDVAGESRRAAPEDGLVQVKLVLPAGEHRGQVTVFREESDEPRGCASFSLDVVAGEVAAAAVDAEEIEDCGGEGEEGEGEEGEGEEGEGEEGEGEEGEGEEGEGEEGEGE